MPIKAGIASPVDLAHATRAEWSEYLVSSKTGSCSKGHVLESDYSVVHLIDRLRTADRLVRLHAFGFLAIWPLLGAAAVSDWTPRLLLGVLAVTLFFNSFGAILNDVVDLPVDRTNPLRARDLLVRGAVSRRQALQLALLQVPIIAIAHLAAGFPPGALMLVAAGLIGMAVYDGWSKSLRVPPVIEASQGAAGSLLVLYGASITHQTMTPAVWLIASSAAVFILFVNAFHGGLRDIENDRACAQRTTPIWLGCRGVIDGHVHITTWMSVYSGILQGLLIVFAVWTAALLGSGPVGFAAVYAASIANLALFWGEHRARKPLWDVLLRVHVAAAATPLMLACMPQLGSLGSMILLAVYVGPLLILDRSHLAKIPLKHPGEIRRVQTSPGQ